MRLGSLAILLNRTVNRTVNRAATLAAMLALASGLAGCGNALECATFGDNVYGRVGYAKGQEIRPGKPVIVEWSEDGFETVGGSSTDPNANGLVSVPYSLCADTDVPIEFRAYVDLNGNQAPDEGESAGRFDGTSDGDADFKQRTITESSDGKWKKIDAIDITIDTP